MSHCLVQGILYLFKQLFIGIKSHIGKSDVLICFQKCNVVFRQVFVGQRTFRSADNISVSRLCPQESGNAYGIGEQIVACSVFLSDGKIVPYGIKIRNSVDPCLRAVRIFILDTLPCVTNAVSEVIIIVFLGKVFSAVEQPGSRFCSDIPSEQDIFAGIHGYLNSLGIVP